MSIKVTGLLTDNVVLLESKIKNNIIDILRHGITVSTLDNLICNCITYEKLSNNSYPIKLYSIIEQSFEEMKNNDN